MVRKLRYYRYFVCILLNTHIVCLICHRHTGDPGAGDGAPGSSGGETTPTQATGRDHQAHSRVPREEGVACQGVQNIAVSLHTCSCVTVETP